MTAAPTTFSPTPHPVLELPDAGRIAALSDEELMAFYAAREEAIAQERSDPMNYGYEPPIWTVCDALLGMPWAEEDWKKRGWAKIDRINRIQQDFEEGRRSIGVIPPHGHVATVSAELEPGKCNYSGQSAGACDPPLSNPVNSVNPVKSSARAFRESLGFEFPVDVLLILGGNRASKSQYAARTRQRLIQWYEDKIVWAFHSTLDMSRKTQQALDWFYFPASWKAKDIKSRWTYMAYKRKTGFSEEYYIAPTRSTCEFKSYDQDQDKAIQGPEIDLATPDEIVPAEWVKDLELRIATRRGKIIVTFTPREGYSDTVAMFLDGAQTVRESVAYLVPKDGGEPEPWSALGLTKEEFEHLWAVERRNEEEKTNTAPLYPQSRPEEFILTAEETYEKENIHEVARRGRVGPAQSTQPASSAPANDCANNDGLRDRAIPGGSADVENPGQSRSADYRGVGASRVDRLTREFETVPRIMRCSDPKRAVVFFHGRDNPFGNPKQVIRNTIAGSRDWILECNYGVARKTVGAAFKKFDWNVHTIPPEAIPPRRDMTIINLWDPHGVARNYAGIWMGITPEHDYLFREWPGNYYIPDIGVPGRWAEPGNKKHPDGTVGPGQRSFGWHHWKYKREIARLEGWPSYLESVGQRCSAASEALPQQRPTVDVPEAVRAWDQWQEREEMVRERQMDSRFASVPIMSSEKPREAADRPRTLLTEYDDWGLTFQRTSGDSVNEGVHDIEAALDYHEKEPISFHNKPRLLISRDCVNTIFALQIWTGLEKDKGATAEWIGLLRYFYRGGFTYIGGESTRVEEEEENQWHEEGVYGR